jgi:hypothetical protein
MQVRGRAKLVDAQQRCKAIIIMRNAWDRGTQCTRRNGHGDNNKYCQQHADQRARRKAIWDSALKAAKVEK